MGSGATVRFRTLGVRPRIPSSRIGLRTLYRLRPENSAGRKRFTNRKPNLRSGFSRTRRTASRSADQSSSGQPPASHEQNPDLLTPRILAIILIGCSASSPASAGSARLPLLFGEEAAAFFKKAFSISSSRMRLLASRSSRSSAFGSGSPASSLRRSWTHLPTIFELSPSSGQRCVIGLPVEMM